MKGLLSVKNVKIIKGPLSEKNSEKSTVCEQKKIAKNQWSTVKLKQCKIKLPLSEKNGKIKGPQSKKNGKKSQVHGQKKWQNNKGQQSKNCKKIKCLRTKKMAKTQRSTFIQKWL